MDSSKCATRCFTSTGVLVTISHCEVLVVSLFPSVELNFVVEPGYSWCFILLCVCVGGWVGGGGGWGM